MRLLKNYFYNIGYQVLNMILPLITGPYIARVLGPEGVGINTYTGAVIQYFVLFGGLGIALYGNRQIAYVKSDKKELSITFWEIQIIKMVTVLLAYLLFLIYLALVHQYRFYLVLQSLYIIATGFDISWLYEGVEDFKKTFTRNTLVRITSLVLILLFVHKSSDVWLYILILAISNLGGYIALWPTISKVIKPIRIKRLNPLRHLPGTLALFIPYLTLNVYPIINKTLLKHFCGVTSSGYYEKSDVMVRMALAFLTSLGTVMLPHTSKAFSDGKVDLTRRLLQKSFSLVSMMAFPIAFGMAAIAPKFGTFFYGIGFRPVNAALFIESFAIVFMGWSSITGTQYLIPTRQTKYYTYSVILGSIINILLDVPLIIIFGLNGAALATTVSEGFIATFQLVSIRNQVNYRNWYQNILKYFASAMIMFFMVYYLNKNLYMNIWTLIIEILIGFLIYGIMLILTQPKDLSVVKSIVEKAMKRIFP
ncbi:oligosaccharide translocase [Levilactobacillus brevis]|uniref:flippase n=2 Tax=Levilactobacillus brevis TaxID=1580 RepID=UPI00111FCBC4|nr:flippase [Levilactobacillus brevis]MCB5231656.1 flippase [Levilactobacillus brevis]MCX7511656.1 flippase [Levilactobacillus brevis]TOY84145.1 oligosaccharide translocase [Levilactobacillus brevis]